MGKHWPTAKLLLVSVYTFLVLMCDNISTANVTVPKKYRRKTIADPKATPG